MVSKLLLAVGENISKAEHLEKSPIVLKTLNMYYDEIKKGIGAHKSPAEYGSFPFDPYSHTPTMAGVKQPGMTGQVKEDILNRFFELGIKTVKGCVNIKPALLNINEFIKSDSTGIYPEINFSYCAIPFTYLLDEKSGIDVYYSDGKTENTESYTLSPELSLKIFKRDKDIIKILVHLSEKSFTL